MNSCSGDDPIVRLVVKPASLASARSMIGNMGVLEGVTVTETMGRVLEEMSSDNHIIRNILQINRISRNGFFLSYFFDA